MACRVIPNYTIASCHPLELEPSPLAGDQAGCQVWFTCAEEFPPGKEIGWNTTQFTPRSLHVILIYASSFLCYPHISKITLTQYQVQFIVVLEV